MRKGAVDPILEQTLPTVWALRGVDVPALASVASRGRVVVVEDVEWLCGAIVVDVSRSDAPYVPTEICDLHEALGFLLGRTVEVLPKYDPTRGRRIHDPWTAGFKAWLREELTMDLIDHWRSLNGRNGQKRVRPTSTTLMEELNGEWYEDDGGFRPDRDRSRQHRDAADQAPGDRGDSGLDALRRRFLEGRDRALLREVEALGLGTAEGAGGRAAGADRDDERVRAAA